MGMPVLLVVAMALGNLERFFYPSVADNFKGLVEVPVFLSRYETLTLTWHTQLYFS
jgi:hypothetical protein